MDSIVYMEGSSMNIVIQRCLENDIPIKKGLDKKWYIHTNSFYKHTGYARPFRHRKINDEHWSELKYCYHYFRASEAYNDPHGMCGKCCTLVYANEEARKELQSEYATS